MSIEEKPVSKPLVMSKSRLNCFISCPKKYYWNYIQEMKPIRTPKALVEGSCIHHLVESGLIYGTSLSDALEQASTHFWAENPFEQCDYATMEDYLATQATCLAQAREFLKQLGPQRVKHVELKVETPLVNPCHPEQVHPDISLLGYIDLVVEGPDGQDIIIDLKTTSRKPSVMLAEYSHELTMYGYMFTKPWEQAYTAPATVALVHLVRTKQPQVIWDISHRSEADYMELFQTVSLVGSQILARNFWKNPATHCSYCDYQQLCTRNGGYPAHLQSRCTVTTDSYAPSDVVLQAV